MDKIPINFAIISRWQNWARILLMVAFAALAFDLLARNLKVKEQ